MKEKVLILYVIHELYGFYFVYSYIICTMLNAYTCTETV